MRIRLLDTPDGRIVAREDQLGALEAEFVLGDDGAVWYTHPADDRPWHAAADVARFRRAAVAWNRYADACLEASSESEELRAVDELEAQLAALGALDDRPENVWPVLLEQARLGHL